MRLILIVLDPSTSNVTAIFWSILPFEVSATSKEASA